MALDPQVQTVIRRVEAAKDKVEITKDGQKVKLVDLAVPDAAMRIEQPENIRRTLNVPPSRVLFLEPGNQAAYVPFL